MTIVAYALRKKSEIAARLRNRVRAARTCASVSACIGSALPLKRIIGGQALQNASQLKEAQQSHAMW
jgi:hypothetical protein